MTIKVMMAMIAVVLFVSLIVFTSANEVRPLCPPNEHYTNCVNDCRVCADPKKNLCNNSVCNKGCECDDGFIRIKQPDGMCIQSEKCVNCGNPDFEFRECGSSCKTTCQDGNIIRNVCPRVCEPGCYCKGNKVLDETENKCLSLAECKQRKKK
ncbi:serine protease inhibitor swm-1-like [Coccinella septempunctata]|uniref:serine protease inhibitor swm-1-like n=1 Tax=Coccinella septempunctata TaxID=41139 RepID=UPI001D0846E0|nr:serine protease inhibitor swm-1-like [Coccinella septempunctata]